uniref:Uncharacterized protein n=1 Tax=Lygus hesperus TaxID=30085 RepID=A0A146KPN1_LYGHE
MDQLQNVVIQGRSQLPLLFKVHLKDKLLTREKFMAGMELIGNGMRKQLTQQQKEAIYEFMRQRSANSDEVYFETFLLCMYVFDNRTLNGVNMPSITEMKELGLGPIYFKNNSFSSLQHISM